MKLKHIFSNFGRLISPMPEIGGLEITDSAIHFLKIKKDSLQRASLRLPPGIIEGGKVKDGQVANLTSALKQVHAQISADAKRVVNVVLSLPDSNTYIQSFNVPKVAETGLAEAAELNLRMISPIPIEASYYGWQKVGETETGGGSLEILGAFMPSANIDQIVTALHGAGFGIAAVEFAALSLVRHLRYLKAISNTSAYLVIHLIPEGLDFVVIKNNNLYFNYFYQWNLIQADNRSISLENLKDAVQSETAKVLNFYLGHWGSQIKNIIVVAPVLREEIKAFIGEKFSSIQLETLDTKDVSVVTGAVLRGKISRADDTDISLTSESAANIFEQEQALRFTSIWRNVLFAVGGFILIIFAITDIYLTKAADNLTKDIDPTNTNQSGIQEVIRLEDKAKDFNRLVGFVSQARNSSQKFSPLLYYLDQLALGRVSFDRIYLQSLLRPVVVSGTAPSENTIVDFKRKLEAQPQLDEVELPLSSIIARSNGQLGFDISFLIKSLSFPAQIPAEEIKAQDDKKQDETTVSQELVNVSEALKVEKPAVQGPLIVFGKLNFKSISEPVTLEVTALDEDTAYLFRDKLNQSSHFKDVEIITGFSKLSDGRVKFQIRFTVIL